MSLITDTVQQYLPPRRKATPSGWVSFNAVCCHHNGTGADTRQRGGIIVNGDGVSYHCFNCQFKASWQPGRQITAKFKKLLQWLNVPDDVITKCSLEALKLKEDGSGSDYINQLPTFFDKALPRGAKPFKEWLEYHPEEFKPVVEYVYNRGFSFYSYPWHWTDEDGFSNRLIIPFYYKDKIVGYTARKITDGKPKYISEQQPGYVFNLDAQTWDRKYVIVCEGPIDAICVDGVAVMSQEVGPQQRMLIDQLKREVIVVPDKDHEGPKIVEQAVEFGWSVSFPEFEDCKDINDAMQKYGRLYTLYNIIKNKENNSLKIQLKAKNWFKGNE